MFQDAATEHTQRHMRMCEELAELGMQLARAAAAQALETETPTKTAATPPEPAHTPDPAKAAAAALLFSRLSRAVRQATLLEARIAADHEAARRAAKPDPRRQDLRCFLHSVAATRPDGASFKREAFEALDDELARDPAATVPDLLATIVETLGLTLDSTNTPSHFARWVWPPLPPAADGPQPEPAARQDPPPETQPDPPPAAAPGRAGRTAPTSITPDEPDAAPRGDGFHRREARPSFLKKRSKKPLSVRSIAGAAAHAIVRRRNIWHPGRPGARFAPPRHGHAPA